MSMVLEARQPAGFGLIGIDRKRLVVTATRMGDMIDASAKRPAIPQIEHVKGQRRLRRQSGMQAVGWLPGFKADTGDEFTPPTGGH